MPPRSVNDDRARIRGFTLIEMMIVVGLIGVASAIAVYSIGRARRNNAVDDFAGAVKNAMIQARRRAISSGGRAVLVDIRSDKVSWCEIPDTGKTSCPQAAQFTQVQPTQARQGVKVEGWRKDVDQGVAGAHLSLPATVYFLPSGRMDSVPASPLTLEGFTLYLEGDPDRTLQRKLTIYPFSGRPRVTDKW